MILRMAVRQAWISYRLLLILVAVAGVAVLVIVADAGELIARGTSWQVLAIGLAGATGLGAAVTGGGLAADRRRGMLGWLAVRATPRGAILAAWYAAPLVAVLLGLGAAATLARMALQPALVSALDDLTYAAATAAVLATAAASAALGLLLGTILSARGAVVVLGVVLASGGAVVAWVGDQAVVAGVTLPTAGFTLLAQSAVVSEPLPMALGAAGMSLVAAAVLLALAGAVFSRRDL